MAHLNEQGDCDKQEISSEAYTRAIEFAVRMHSSLNYSEFMNRVFKKTQRDEAWVLKHIDPVTLRILQERQ